MGFWSAEERGIILDEVRGVLMANCTYKLPTQSHFSVFCGICEMKDDAEGSEGQI